MEVKSSVGFVTKPVEAPWTDGTKNLVRDLVVGLDREVVAFSTRGEPLALGKGTRIPRGPESMPFGARVLAEFSAKPPGILHFFFAPNPRSCGLARAWILALRLRGFRGKTVQTVASRPREWTKGLFFADRVVVQSEWAKGELARVREKGISVIPPSIPQRVVTDAEAHAAREALQIDPGARLVVYPGDLEFSRGAFTSARAFALMARKEKDLVLVLACRRKTERAKDVEGDLARYLEKEGVLPRVRFAGEVPDLSALLAASALVLFPVEDLYGKVDHPLVLLEARSLGIPCVLSDHAPLRELPAIAHLPAFDAPGFAEAGLKALRTTPRVEPVRLGADTFVAAYEAVYRSLDPR